jgi:hypothetical protein
MFFRKTADLQRLNLEGPKPEFPPTPTAPLATPSIPLSSIDPAILEAVEHRAKGILDSGRIPEWLFVCQVVNGLLMVQSNDRKPVMLLFSSPSAATDYLRSTGTAGDIGQLKVETLPNFAQSWLSLGVQEATLDRCPRCPECLAYSVAAMAKWTREDFAKAWARQRATRLIMGATRIRSAINHLATGSHAAARSDLEYVRDHFDCGVPYLHQMIGLLAGMQEDQQAKAASLERLREFGPEFDYLDLSPDLLPTAMAGMLLNFGMGDSRHQVRAIPRPGVVPEP